MLDKQLRQRILLRCLSTNPNLEHDLSTKKILTFPMKFSRLLLVGLPIEDNQNLFQVLSWISEDLFLRERVTTMEKNCPVNAKQIQWGKKNEIYLPQRVKFIHLNCSSSHIWEYHYWGGGASNLPDKWNKRYISLYTVTSTLSAMCQWAQKERKACLKLKLHLCVRILVCGETSGCFYWVGWPM